MIRRKPLPPSLRAPSRRRRKRMPAPALMAICLVLFGVVVLTMVAGHTAVLDRAGIMAFRGANGAPMGPAWLLPAMRALTLPGGTQATGALTLALCVMLGWKRGVIPAAARFFVFALGWMLVADLRRWIDRPRPALVPILSDYAGPSFPSSHAFNAALVFTTAALVVPVLWPRLRGLAPVLVAIGMAVAVSRVWLGMHWPSDVLAGWLLGTGWALGADWVAAGVERRGRRF
jgi:undecaprenyl-diphosphatase